MLSATAPAGDCVSRSTHTSGSIQPPLWVGAERSGRVSPRWICSVTRLTVLQPALLSRTLSAREAKLEHRTLGRAIQVYGIAGAALLCLVQPCHAQEAAATASATSPSSLVGEYVHSQMELVAGIRLNPDGTFLYGLTVGSLDERAQGRWKASGNRIELTSDPRPIAPVITPAKIEAAPSRPFALRIVAPNGRDIPGVDLLLEFDAGEPLQSYAAGEPWTLPVEERRTPRFVTFSMPSYRLRSDRLPLDAKAGTVANFTLTPNDFGVADLTGVQGEIQGDTLTLLRPEGTMQFRRAEK